MLKLKCIDQAQFEKIGFEWNELLRKSESNGIFMTWEWLHTWWQNFGSEKDLFVLLVLENDESLVGIIPLYREIRKSLFLNKLQILKFLGSEEVGSDYLDFIMLPGMEECIIKAFLRFLKDNQKDWDVFIGSDIFVQSRTLYLMKLLCKEQNYFISTKFANICPVICLPHSFQELEMQLSTHMKSNIRWGIRKLDVMGAKYYRIENGYIKKELNNLFRLHELRFKQKGENTQFTSSPIQKLHEDFAAVASPKGWLRLTFLEVAGRKIASLYGFEYNNRFWYYQSGFDPAYSKYSPGMVLIWMNLQESIENGCEEFDHLRGNEAYKWKWTKQFRETNTIMVFKNNFVAIRYYFFEQAKLLFGVMKRSCSGFFGRRKL